MSNRIAATACVGFTLALAAAVAPVQAQVIDQNQPDASVHMASFSQTNLAQSFRQSADNIVGAGIFLQPGVGAMDNVTISLWTNLPNAGGSLLATGSAMGAQGTWVDVFWAAVGVDPMQTYFLVFDGNTTLGIAGSIENPYQHGHVYANPGYQPFPSFDYTFRTWASDGTPPSPVPEPLSVLLLATGLAGIGLVRRRRREHALLSLE